MKLFQRVYPMEFEFSFQRVPRPADTVGREVPYAQE